MKTSLLPLQKAIYDRLSGDATLNNIITGVYDQVSADAVFPYVSIGEDNMTPRGTKNYNGENITTTLHCWSDYPGKKEAKQILDLMLQALTNTPLELSGFSLVLSKVDQMRVFTDIDGTTRHGVLVLRYYINNKE
jgi:truncated hemoglobin YjbI